MPTPSKPKKPAKPYPDFPLFAHQNGCWAKKIRGTLCYFGPWADWQGAARKYQEEREDLYAGRTPRVSAGVVKLRDILNGFLTSKQLQVDAGELSKGSFADYHAVAALLVDRFGATRPVDSLQVADFEALRAAMARRLGPSALAREVQSVRTIFKYAYDAGLIEAPVRTGPNFKRPPKRTLRLHQQAQGPRMFEAEEIRTLVAAASPHLAAMILLGVNCGFGPGDIGLLMDTSITAGWVSLPRHKTAIPRRCPLWSETLKAIELSRKSRPKPKRPEAEGKLFITKRGGPWCGDTSTSLTSEFTKLMREHGLYVPGRSFYGLRRTFETIGGDTGDQIAVSAIMGHVDDSMSGIYRQRIEDDRLERVANHVRGWLFPPKKRKSRAK